MKTKIDFQSTIFYCYLFLFILTGIFLLPNLAIAANITSENIIKATNNIRIKNGINSLTANQLLTAAAYKKGKAIFAAQIFSHSLNGKKFSAWIKQAGYRYSYAGENLAINFVTAEGVIKAWLNSPTHRRNLLNKNFSEIGVAIVKGEFQNQNTILIVQIFGSPPPYAALNEPNYNVFKPLVPNSLTVLYSHNQLTANNSREQILKITSAKNETPNIQSVFLSSYSTPPITTQNKKSSLFLNNIAIACFSLIFFLSAFLGTDYLKNLQLSLK